MRIPYGISNFEELREKGYLYVDKTKYIEMLEEDAPYQFFIRPRRFGKSLFISMLENYYDINAKDKFDKLFKDLYIGKNLTDGKNSFLVWKISFAGVDSGNSEESLRESFNFKVFGTLQEFINKYSDILKVKGIPATVNSAEKAVEFVRVITKNVEKKVFVLIDEYDNFANELITVGKRNTYEGILHGEGFVRTFYKALKDAAWDNFTKIFMTGVSPIMLDDLTSGFNITKNLTIDEKYNEMLGFTNDELKDVLKIYENKLPYAVDKVVEDMKLYYNGYLFSSRGKERLYNSNMVLYFLDSIKNYGKYPENILDSNIKTDYKKIENLAFNFKDEETINKLMTNGEIQSSLVEKFNLEYMYSSGENFISLLFYMGMLTIKEAKPNRFIFNIPNYVIKTVYWEYYLDKLQHKNNIDINKDELYDAIDKMAINGKAEKFKTYLEKLFLNLSNRDLMQMDEKYIKVVLMTLFYENNYYIVNSEYEVEEGYIDIFLTKNKAFLQYINYEWMIELKYVKESNKNSLEEVMQEGIEQLKRYSSSKKLKDTFEMDKMKKLLIITVGKKEVYFKLVE